MGAEFSSLDSCCSPVKSTAAAAACCNPRAVIIPHTTLNAESSAGIGVIIAYEPNSAIAVERVIVGGPADQQCPGKVQPGDVLESVDGKTIEGLKSTEVARVVRGKPTSRITLGLRRGDDTFTLTLLRDINRTNIFDNQEWEKAFGFGKKPSGTRTFLVL